LPEKPVFDRTVNYFRHIAPKLPEKPVFNPTLNYFPHIAPKLEARGPVPYTPFGVLLPDGATSVMSGVMSNVRRRRNKGSGTQKYSENSGKEKSD